MNDTLNRWRGWFSLVPSVPTISRTFIPQFLDTGRQDGYPAILLIPEDEEYDIVMWSILRKAKKFESYKGSKQAILAWIEKIRDQKFDGDTDEMIETPWDDDGFVGLSYKSMRVMEEQSESSKSSESSSSADETNSDKKKETKELRKKFEEDSSSNSSEDAVTI